MPKKRGGRRGKASGKGPDDGAQPSTSQQKTDSPEARSFEVGAEGPSQSLAKLKFEETSTPSTQLLSLPKPGTLGRKIPIETNHVQLNFGSLKEVYRYDVTIEPEKKPKRMLRAAMELFRKTYFPENYPSYDGQKLLFSASRLLLNNDWISETVILKEDKFKITIKFSGMLNFSPLHNLLQKKNIGQEQAFQCVEIVFRQAYTNSFLNVGRKFYIPSGRNVSLGGGAEMYLGGYQAAVKGWKAFLNVDIAHKAFTKSVALTDLLLETFTTRYKPLTEQDLKIGFATWQMQQMSEYLSGLKVIYQIPNHPGSKKVYRVNGFGKLPSQETFQHDGHTISVENYFNSKWHCVLKYPKLPTLWVGNKEKRICLPFEFCTLQAGQAIDAGKMTASQTSKMIQYSATNTFDRKKKIQQVMDVAGHNKHPCIREFGFSISDEFHKLDARVLDPPTLQYSNGTVQPKKGVWRGKQFNVPAAVKKWIVVVFGDVQKVKGKVQEFVAMVTQLGQAFGMSFNPPDPPHYIPRPDFRSLVSFFQQKNNYDLIVVVIQSRKEHYFWVKQISELQVGVLTQCIKIDTLYKLNDSTVGNILLKINNKMNGTSRILQDLALITKNPCMVMGADVTHPSPHARSIPSVVAVTASHDFAATCYNISVRLQDPKTEIINDLESITLEKLRIFKERTKKEPSVIFFLRDGVSEGEFEKVKRIEVEAIISACNRYREGYCPKVSFLIVQKRHHTRFFPLSSEICEGDRNFNVPVGTCVDTDITDPDFALKNFYLVSHASIRGVARPTKYWTLHDDNNLSYDDVQKLVYYLCHVFERCNRSVSYPAPTYYAHLAADRAKGYLFGKNIDMENLDSGVIQVNEGLAKSNPSFFT